MLMEQARRLLTFIRTQFKWFTRLPVIFVVLLAIPNPISHAFLEGMGPVLGFEEPSLATLVGVAMLFLILERVIIIEDETMQLEKRFRESGPLQVYETRSKLGELLSNQKKVGQIDILQFTGFAMGDFLSEVANLHPEAKVRMLLCHPERAKEFDPDWVDDTGRQVHEVRIYATIDKAEMLKRDLENNRDLNFDVQIRYYRVIPSVSAVIVDGKKVNLSWYRYFPAVDDTQKRKVIRIEGHSSTTITGSGESADPLLSFGRKQFDALWETGEEVRSKQKRTAKLFT